MSAGPWVERDGEWLRFWDADETDAAAAVSISGWYAYQRDSAAPFATGRACGKRGREKADEALATLAPPPGLAPECDICGGAYGVDPPDMTAAQLLAHAEAGNLWAIRELKRRADAVVVAIHDLARKLRRLEVAASPVGDDRARWDSVVQIAGELERLAGVR